MEVRKNRNFIFFTALTIAWMIIIFLFSAQPAEESYKTSDLVLAFQQKYFDTFFDKLTPFIIRKTAHMAEFGLLALLLLAFLRSGREAFIGKFSKINHYLGALLITSLYAFTDELHQYFVPGRNATFLDWLFDSFGALTALWIVYVILAKIKKRADKSRVSS